MKIPAGVSSPLLRTLNWMMIDVMSSQMSPSYAFHLFRAESTSSRFVSTGPFKRNFLLNVSRRIMTLDPLLLVRQLRNVILAFENKLLRISAVIHANNAGIAHPSDKNM